MTARQSKVDEVKSAIKSITAWTAKRYFEWQATPLSIDDLPCIEVRDTTDTLSQSANCTDHVLSVSIRVYTNETIETLRDVIGYIVDALKSVNGLTVDSVAIFTDQDEDRLIGCEIETNIAYQTEGRYSV